MTKARWLRHGLVLVLLGSAVLPLALLGVSSVAREWFYPALGPSALTGSSWVAVWQGGGRIASAFGTSVGLAIATGVAAAAVGWPLGRMLADLSGWRRHLGASAAFLPVAAPPIALGTGLHLTMLTLGMAGTALGVLLSHLVPAIGYATLYFFGVFSAVDRGMEEEARALGATPRQVLWRVSFPLLRGQAAAAALLGFLVSWSQVALTLVIGGGQVRTLPLEVLGYVQAGQDRAAATGSLLLVLPPLVLLGVTRMAVARAEAVPL